MSEIDYKLKYLKYKKKYLGLKSATGGYYMSKDSDMFFISDKTIIQAIRADEIEKEKMKKPPYENTKITKKDGIIAYKKENTTMTKKFQPWITLVEDVTSIDIKVRSERLGYEYNLQINGTNNKGKKNVNEISVPVRFGKELKETTLSGRGDSVFYLPDKVFTMGPPPPNMKRYDSAYKQRLIDAMKIIAKKLKEKLVGVEVKLLVSETPIPDYNFVGSVKQDYKETSF